MSLLLEIADHVERLSTQVGDEDIARQMRVISHRASEVEDTEDIFWLSLGGCLSEFSKNLKMRGISTELAGLSRQCVLESRRLQRSIEVAA